MFLGRERELARLQALLKKDTASLVVLRGRRRIGKSTLVERFAGDFERFCEFQGLAPRPGLDDDGQRRHFSEQMAKNFGVPALELKNWTEAFSYLASHTRRGRVLVFLDEISWMAGRDPDFAGKLKVAWDTEFKKNPKLMLVICGSVSSWIDRNLLHDADFVGRLSLDLKLEELPLPDCHKFWGKRSGRISAFEKARILCVTGGVPKYLEEINMSENAESNILRLCFQRSGFLFHEFERIFSDVFQRRAQKYREIVHHLVAEKLSANDVAQRIGMSQNGDITEYLHDLEESGFLARDHAWDFSGKRSRLSRYRIRDNYLRFHLKYVDPVRDKIETGLYDFRGIESLRQWPSIMGYQFENLILNNLRLVVDKLGIDSNTILYASPHFQNKTRAIKGACQIDLLIHTTFSTLYVCEIKCRPQIGSEIIPEMKKKISVFKRPKGLSVRPVLIHAGEVADSVRESGFFDSFLSFEELIRFP